MQSCFKTLIPISPGLPSFLFSDFWTSSHLSACSLQSLDNSDGVPKVNANYIHCQPLWDRPGCKENGVPDVEEKLGNPSG